MSLASFSVRNVPFTLVAVGLVVALGLQAFVAIPRAEDPAFPLASYLVIAVYPGASPADVERLVAEPIEDAVAELDDLDETRTTVSDGLSVTRVEFDARVDADRTYDKVLREVSGLALPPGVVSVEVRQLNPGDTNILQVALTSETATYRLLGDTADDLKANGLAVTVGAAFGLKELFSKTP